ncbi:Putative GTP cyclohydrolase 1 type 2 [Anatilimnocola aggregata]|uniref:GTP cyclohydrolase 1 type 2 homolog n=1 Tax=Anatilimnocola aggregata TaxID=2528021 RepID=A0A517YBS9_9BACT|nr:Nif3-like dinuclear metal center hexameric protein [Anatilimnocola aggregata]QDU27697.1 Putative GTP cyclohydrolase 1 type 2 [Anatilimnocola aggregata]
MMTTIADISSFFASHTPLSLAEDWDNVGLLAGDPAQPVTKIMTCLTITAASAAEAIHERAELIVTHHPLPFKPLKRLTTEQTPGRLLWSLARAGVAIFSPHTAFDSAAAGINQQLAEGIGLTQIQPLVPAKNDPNGLGSGRIGTLTKPITLQEAAALLANFLKIDGLQMVGEPNQKISRIGIACGSAGSFLPAAADSGCQLLITGETTFHTCLEAEALGLSLLLPGHYASERFACEQLAVVLKNQFPGLEVWPSRAETDPVRWLPLG